MEDNCSYVQNASEGRDRDEEDLVIYATSSSQEFDLKQFRKASILTPHNTLTQKNLQILQTEQQQQQKGIDLTSGAEQVQFMGIKFQLKYLLERNKNPAYVLSSIYGLLGLADITHFIIFIIGTNFEIFPIIITILIIPITCFMVTKILQKQSVAEGIKFNKKDIFFSILNAISQTALVLFCFIKNVPFDSLSYYLIGLYFLGFFYMTMAAILNTQNKNNFDDPNYQLKFFVPRILIGILNATGQVDAMTDIVFGVQILRQFDSFVKILGILLLVFCFIDCIFLNIRATAPHKLTIMMQLFSIFLELGILFVTIFAGVFVVEKQADREFIFLLVLSILTTTVNFLHHIFVVIQWLSNKKLDKQVSTFGDVFE